MWVELSVSFLQHGDTALPLLNEHEHVSVTVNRSGPLALLWLAFVEFSRDQSAVSTNTIDNNLFSTFSH